MDAYASRLQETKSKYPFAEWSESGMEQYTPESCAAFIAIFDKLIAGLMDLGEPAPEADKMKFFQQAVEALNELNETDPSLIETMEREDLCDLCNHIAIAAGIDPDDYGDGEGPASEWRDW